MRWYACLEASARRQLELRGVTAQEIDRRLAGLRELPWYYRSADFHRELDAIDLEAAWRSVDRPVLVMHGEHDAVVSREEHERIAELVPGAKLVALDGLDHLFTRHADARGSLEAYGAGAVDTSLAHAVADFARLVFDREQA
jgi:pimeloyl-ACP methyl ester carboxylesterase